MTSEKLLSTDRAQKAMALFSEGYNCAQSSLLAFADLLPIDEAGAKAVASSFGGGMGKMGEVCGAITGVFAAAGLLYGPSELVDADTKMAHYECIQKLGLEFKARTSCDSYLCRDLLEKELPAAAAQELDASKLTYAIGAEKPCAQLVGVAAGLLEVYIQAHPIK